MLSRIGGVVCTIAGLMLTKVSVLDKLAAAEAGQANIQFYPKLIIAILMLLQLGLLLALGGDWFWKQMMDPETGQPTSMGTFLTIVVGIVALLGMIAFDQHIEGLGYKAASLVRCLLA